MDAPACDAGLTDERRGADDLRRERKERTLAQICTQRGECKKIAFYCQNPCVFQKFVVPLRRISD